MNRDCAAARLLLSVRLDGLAPDPQDDAALATHLAACPACRVFARDLAVQEQTLVGLWSPVAAPEGFARRVIAALPPRPIRRSSGRRFLIAAALTLALLSGALLGRSEVRAGIDLALRRVGLREQPPPAQIQTAPLRDVSPAEAQALVPWAILQPAPLPVGYRLDHAAVGAVYAFAEGPVVFLFYTRDGAATPQLVLTQFRATGKAPIDAPVAPGAGRRVAVGDRSGLFIDGMWVERGGQQVWETGALVRLIIEDGAQVAQFEADPSAGWDEASLVALAESLR
jgi:hypothetical protein